MLIILCCLKRSKGCSIRNMNITHILNNLTIQQFNIVNTKVQDTKTAKYGFKIHYTYKDTKTPQKMGDTITKQKYA